MDNSQIGSVIISLFNQYLNIFILLGLAIAFLLLAIICRHLYQIQTVDVEKSIKELSAAKSVQEVASSQISILNGYYNNVLSQSQMSFRFALFTAFFGFLFFLAAAVFLLIYNLQSLAQITVLGGALSSIISLVNFHLYNKSSSQLADFQQRLDMTQRFLLSEALCNTIKDPDKQDATRADLIMTIIGSDLKK